MRLPIWICSRTWLAFMAGFLLVWSGMQSAGQSAGADEQEVRALMLYNITKFVDWPATRTDVRKTAFVFCIEGDEGLASSLVSLTRGKEVSGEPVLVRPLENAKHTESCDVLYAPEAQVRHFGDAGGEPSRTGLLTVSGTHLSRDGTVVGLPSVQNRIKIEIDLTAAQRNGLTISSRLLEIATVTR